ncbi:MAG: DUF937 domain-containing protein [Pseudomonadota bacterium]
MIEAIIREKLNRPISAAGDVVGFDDAQAEAALNALWPSLSKAIKESLKSPRDLNALTSLVKRGKDYARYVEEPEALSQPEAIIDGEAVLQILLGSDSKQNAVAQKAVKSAKLDFTSLDNFMSLMASAILGAIAIQMRETDFTAILAKSALGMVGLGGLSGMVDKHRAKDKRKKKLDQSLGGLGSGGIGSSASDESEKSAS